MEYSYINSEIVKEGEITSIEDLLAPKWKGKIVMNDPRVGGPGNGWFSFIMLQAYGMERGREFMQRLARQEPVIIRDERLQIEWVARGKYPVGLGLTPAETLKMARAGAPIRTLPMKEGQPLNSGTMNLIVFDKAPHPHAAKLYVNWILSREGGEIMSKYSGYISARRDVPNFGFDASLIPGPKDILPGEEYNLKRGELQKVAAEIFRDALK